MAISGSRLMSGFVKTQMRADAARRQSDELRQNCFDLRLVYRAGAVRVDIERQRLGHADSIAELDSAALRKPCGNDILGEITAYIRGGTVNLGRVLRSEEHTSELQSLMRISYAVFCLTKKKQNTKEFRPSHVQSSTH